ncbi:hypothetical protein HGH92_30425 [Chitinophaga varians]|uniref:Uncharacterized protein n=1 Tax=Chitinophaga varians TaxID=2202339 RepID=A0A847S6E7_9BACT|nr:hypothetical protein [Chitinophaga varians]NLR68658.1 hypothetical protein [Chitinophaga varians]
MLTEDIKIYCPAGLETENRIWISKGLQKAPATEDGFSFESDAYRPGLPWRVPEAEETAVLFTTDAERTPSRTIGLSKLPEDIADIFIRIGLPGITSDDELKILRKHHAADYIAAMEGMYAYMGSFQCDSPEAFSKIGVVINEPDKRSVTINLKNGCLTGLHLDSWDRLDIGKLDTATNRICFNLGAQDRFFLFTNLSVKTLCGWVEQQLSVNPYLMSKNELCQLFFTHWPEYPVVKLRVKPFEAYIAPTENLIHDGCTEGGKQKDICCTARGYFNVADNIKKHVHGH